MNKENISVETSFNEFNDSFKKVNALKSKIEDEINKINSNYEKTINYIKKFYFEMHEKLRKEQKELTENFNIEITKTKEKLENYLSLT